MEEPKNAEKMLKVANLANSDAFKKLNKTTQNSLLGRIACQNMINNVPNLQTFCLVLKAVRFWALQRGIYSINQGYLGGVTIAVMVAKICQDFPDLQPACTLFKFFETYAEWRNWVEPVQISLHKKYKQSQGGNLLRTDLIAKVDRYSQDKMVVLTPNDQLENTSYRVKEHNLLVIIQELNRGQKMLKRLKPRSKVLFKPITIDVKLEEQNENNGNKPSEQDS